MAHLELCSEVTKLAKKQCALELHSDATRPMERWAPKRWHSLELCLATILMLMKRQHAPKLHSDATRLVKKEMGCP